MNENNTRKMPGWSEDKPRRKWNVWINGIKKDEIMAVDAESATTAARKRWRAKPTDAVDVKPKYPLGREGPVKGSADLSPTTPHDGHIVRVALEILEWPRETLRSRAAVRNRDLANLLHGGTNGAVKSEVFKVLREGGCDPDEISQLITRVKERAGRAKEGDKN
jgi:hypothetical protein